ncbi:hypothetical protein SU65_01605 [Flavobacterium psychrophilum]|nr:hypothetical protein SU65_01605 [Flavobacterium psychrophilum]
MEYKSTGGLQKMKKLLLISIILLITISCNKKGEQQIIVVPKNFKGYIILIHNQKDGMPTKYKGKKRIYEIPKNGILKTQFDTNDGWQEFSEFYYDKIIPENKLSSFAEIGKVPINKVVGFMGANGTVRKDSKSNDRIEFSEFYIGTKSEIEISQEQVEKLDIVELSK